ncbi:MAG TPA: magnesium transporter [Chthoniobacteraceae bacterium]|nr:magnesium transporter [Chthoniobacteraceae bacterium]
MPGNLFGPEIRDMIAHRRLGDLHNLVAGWPPADIADLFDDLSEDDRVIVFRVLPHVLAADVFEYLDLGSQQHLLRAMAHEETAAVLNEMSPDDRTALFEELPGHVVTQLLHLLSPGERAVAQTLLNYPERSVGRLMTPDFIALRDEWTIAEALDFIRRTGHESETLDVVYVVDEKGRLQDDLRIRELLIRPLDTGIADIRDQAFVALNVNDDRGAAIEVFKKYDHSALPVVDGEGVLVGMVTVDDVIDVSEKETTRKIQRIGGMEALDEPYLTIPMARMVRKRGPWLAILFIGEMMTAVAMAYFQEELQKVVLLAIFIPLIISSGGNSGSQASTLVIRAMAVGEVRLRDWWRVMRREITSGVLLGLLLGSLGVLRIVLWSLAAIEVRGRSMYGEHWVLVAVTIGCSLVGVVLWGTLAGSMLPFLLRSLGIDPATSSAPFVATLVDVTGLIIYFTIAGWILSGTLL